MLRSLFGIDWRNSPPHLLLLSKFIKPRSADDFATVGGWQEVLKESPQLAVKRFVNEGVLVQSDLDGHLAFKFKASELKEMLKQRGMPVSGKKDELIRRLVQTDPEAMKKAVAGLTVLQCSQQGRAVAERYLSDEEARRSRAEQQVMEAIRGRRFREASRVVAQYESTQVFRRGIGIDWKNYDTGRDEAILSGIFSGVPKQLESLSPVFLEQFRTAACMMSLWGTNQGKQWLSIRDTTGLTADCDVAIRMLESYAIFRYNITDFKRHGVGKVRVNTCSDEHVCQECRKLASKTYKLSEVPDLPYARCSSEHGCRCFVAPAI